MAPLLAAHSRKLKRYGTRAGLLKLLDLTALRLPPILLINLGSGLIDQSQKMTAAAMQIAEKWAWAQRSYRVWMRLQSLSLPNMFSILWRCL
jgi:hypothetical protein